MGGRERVPGRPFCPPELPGPPLAEPARRSRLKSSTGGQGGSGVLGVGVERTRLRPDVQSLHLRSSSVPPDCVP